jgi:formylglycine-generating enzyme required for sulfatase activity
MLAREPEDRFQTPAEVARALEPFSHGQADAPARGPGAVQGGSPDSAETVVGDARHSGAAPSLLSSVALSLAKLAHRLWDTGPTPPLSPPPTERMRSSRPVRRMPAAVVVGSVLFLLVVASAPWWWPRRPPPRDPSPGDVLVNSISMKLVRVPAGAFLMGAPADEAERGDDEGPQHQVEIARPFWIGVHEVTQAQFQAVMGYNRSHFSPEGAGKATQNFGRLPVEMVSWDEANDFCQRLSARERTHKRSYRLPTEAEWEYVCRAGTTSPFHLGGQLSGNDANFDGRRPYGGAPMGGAREYTMPVGSFLANAFGLFDVHGNVWEWCADRYLPYDQKLQPGGPNQPGSGRIVRGGGWLFSAADCRCARRVMHDQDHRSEYVGFRVVCDP